MKTLSTVDKGNLTRDDISSAIEVIAAQEKVAP